MPLFVVAPATVDARVALKPPTATAVTLTCSLAVPTTNTSPATIADAWLAENTMPLLPVTAVYVPDSVEDHAAALGHTETFNELPKAPGYLATNSPTPVIPAE